MKALLDLLRSMRFAVAILAVVAVASTIGSVLEQAQPAVAYVSAYGEFWAHVFTLAGLTDVYHAWWFFLLLGVMATSTTLGLILYTPQMLHEMRTFREHKSVASLRRMQQSAELPLLLPHAASAALPSRLADWLRKGGYRYRQQALSNGSLMLAASTGMSRRAGYLLVHAAIVLICIGGLVDGNLALRWQLLSGGKVIERRDFAISDVPERSRLAADAGSFRGAMNLTEGDSGSGVLLSMGDGYLLRELPFAVRLKQFRVDHYEQGGLPTARPSDFVSEIEIIDGGTHIPATLRVNHPFSYRGVTLYQSGFADGGSKVRMQILRNGQMKELEGKVGAGTALLLDGEPYTLELEEWRTNNVVKRDAGQGKALEDVGPSLSFRLRDKTGQAAEWLVYRKPIRFDGALYAVTGMRAAGKSEMHYARIPLDADGGAGAYGRLAAALSSPGQRRALALASVVPNGASASLAGPTQALLDAFAARGYRGVAELVQRSVPESEQLRAGELYSALIERALQAVRPVGMEPQGAPPVRALMDAYSDAIDKDMPLRFTITGIEQRNASVLQVAHAPGAWLVYLGCAMLAVGVCCMYFVRERRLWLVLDRANGTLLAAYAGNRDSPSLPNEFRQHHAALAALCKQP
jgi:cytochrome c biogenesis protein